MLVCFYLTTNEPLTLNPPLYASIRGLPYDLGKKVLKNPSYTYKFADGRENTVWVSEVEKEEAARIKKRSHGFLGKDWMINSIIKHGRIKFMKLDYSRNKPVKIN